MDKLFDPFFTKDEGEGTGLELSICQGVVEAHRLIKGEVRRLVSAEGGFKPHEHVTTIALLPGEFTPGRELTHTLKMRRGVIHDLHAETIEGLYRRRKP